MEQLPVLLFLKSWLKLSTAAFGGAPLSSRPLLTQSGKVLHLNRSLGILMGHTSCSCRVQHQLT